MPYFRRNLFDDLEDMQRQMDRFLGHFAAAKRPICLYSPTTWQPAVDIYETAADIIVVVEAAGLDKDSLEISMDRTTLVVRGERPDTPRGVRQSYHLAEITFGGFERDIEIPVAVDADRASAIYNDGMLEIVLPKSPEAVAKRVRIRTD